MKESIILQQLFKSFHQPPSLSSKESSKLLSLLTSSFRKELDTEHGFEFSKKNLQNASAKKPHTRNQTTMSQRRRSFSESIPPTERLFRSILTDPLLAGSNAQPGVADRKKKPMELFDLAVSRGLMTMDKCYECLLAEKRKIVAGGALTVWEGMKDSGAGLKVLKWLKASGSAEGGEYFRQMDGKFFNVFAPFAAAQGLQEVLWHDFTALCSATNPNPRVIGQALLHLIHAELGGPNSLDGGISSLTRAYSILESFPHIRRAIIQPGARLLSHDCTINAQLYTKPTLENFTALKDIIIRVIVRHNSHIAYLDLHHPNSPSPKKALELINGLPENSSCMAPKKFISLGLDTAKYLLKRKQFREARRVLRLLSNSFPDQNLARDNGSELRHARSEASNLELLQGLNLA